MEKDVKVVYYAKLKKGGYDVIINVNGHDVSNFYYALDYKSLRKEYKGYKFAKVDC